MRILVIGGGAREHAIVWRLARDPEGHDLICAPGNPGISHLARCVEAPVADVDRLLAVARAEHPELVVVGPEAPLCAGLADALSSDGIPVFGPSASAARLEGSKVFAKQFMRRHGIPTAPFAVFEDEQSAREHVSRRRGAMVIKADGLASGKGVAVCGDGAEAAAAIGGLLGDRRFGDASRRIVIEDCLPGREASLMALVSGEQIFPLPPAEDHKAVLDGDRGPMTGGMGALSPTPVLDEPLVRRVVRDVLEPAARACVAEGFPFHGILYVGLMIVRGEPYVLEFNCRLGDPEAEVLLPRLGGSLAETLRSVAAGRQIVPLPSIPGACVSVMMAASGYPGTPRTGDPIEGLEDVAAMQNVVVFHAGTRIDAGRHVTAGGRVLAVTAMGADATEARARAYGAVRRIRFAGAHYRTDIGSRGAVPNATKG